MFRASRSFSIIPVLLLLSLVIVALAPSAAFAARLSSDWKHANIHSVASASASTFKLKVDAWNLDVSKLKRLTFTAKKTSCDYYIAKAYFSPTFSKVSYKTFASYVAKRPGAVCDVKYTWRKNAKGQKYRVAQTVWADGFAR